MYRSELCARQTYLVYIHATSGMDGGKWRRVICPWDRKKHICLFGNMHRPRVSESRVSTYSV
jgi:hypothetical protein